MLWQCTISSAAKHCMVLMKYRSYYHCARHFEGSGEGGFALSFFFLLKNICGKMMHLDELI